MLSEILRPKVPNLRAKTSPNPSQIGPETSPTQGSKKVAQKCPQSSNFGAQEAPQKRSKFEENRGLELSWATLGAQMAAKTSPEASGAQFLAIFGGFDVAGAAKLLENARKPHCDWVMQTQTPVAVGFSRIF